MSIYLRFLSLLTLLFTKNTFSQLVHDGNITEAYWGIPLGTSAGGPSSCLGPATNINALYAAADEDRLHFAIAGSVINGNKILVFIDCKTGGYERANFGRSEAPDCIKNFNNNNKFDTGFTPDYCLIIGSNTANDNFQFYLYTLTGTVQNGGSILDYIGNVGITSSASRNGFSFGAAPDYYDFTKGFEIGIPKTIVQYNPLSDQQTVKLMVMSISDGGLINNQFIGKADLSEGCYGIKSIDFGSSKVNPLEYNPSRILPISFLNIHAAQIRQSIKIFWESASEKELKEYLIQRSEDAISFKEVGKVMAKGNSNSALQYNFTDVNPFTGKSFYRIKAIDINGRSTYSSIVKINYGWVDNNLFIYPNPVIGKINLQMIGLKPGLYNLEIFNDIGQKLITKKIEYFGGYGLQQIPLLRNMKKGPYRLLLRNDAIFYKQSFIVQ